MEYEKNYSWDDVKPVLRKDNKNEIAPIAYTKDYLKATAYLCALMQVKEISDRALALTSDIIYMNAAHYTVWAYRLEILLEQTNDNNNKVIEKLINELNWIEQIAEANPKNYQIWNYRESIFEAVIKKRQEIKENNEILSKNIDSLSELIDKELIFTEKMFSDDAKNYHVWLYRQFLVQRFNLWALNFNVKDKIISKEISFVNNLLEQDIMNNSAWNHRYFVLFGHEKIAKLEKLNGEKKNKALYEELKELSLSKNIINSEIKYAFDAIKLAPQNQSPWLYLRGILNYSNTPIIDIENECLKYVSIFPDYKIENNQSQNHNQNSESNWEDVEGSVRSTHALEFLAEINSLKGDNHSTSISKSAYDLLATKYDPIRSRYWLYQKSFLE